MTDKYSNIHIPRWNELPNIDLYMDQVVTFVENNLGAFIKNDTNNEKEEGTSKILTKTMINNYVKQGVIEAPVKKKYNRRHLSCLFAICILKQVYSISDINTLMKSYIDSDSIEKSYNSFCEELENAINITFSGKENIVVNANLSQDMYVLKNVVQSFASKLYVQIVYLNKDK